MLSEWISFSVVIADDDEDDLELFEKAFQELAPGFTISKTSNSAELVNTLTGLTQLPDLIIIDLNMPAKNGFELLKEIRFNKKLAHIPVMVYSTTANAEQVQKTYELGANLYLQKPHNYEGIKTLIKKLITMDPELYVPQAEKAEFLFRIA